MCGIAGILSSRRDNINLKLDRMLLALEHRGPDDQGKEIFQINQNLNLALGHQRLSIIDLSPKGHQPMFDNSRDCCIVFNGEIYNYVELAESIKHKSTFVSHSDTEVLLHYYKLYGSEMLRMLDGMYSFVIYDKKKGCLFGARDPIGIKPFYYQITKDTFSFASEPEALLQVDSRNGKYNHESLSNFMLFGVSDYSSATMLSGIEQLQGGHYFEIYLNETPSKLPQIEFWTSPSITDLSLEETQLKYNFLLEDSIKKQLRSDVKVGSSLSGGIDSGAIVITAGEILKSNEEDYSTLTFTYPGFKNDESVFAKLISQKAGFKWFNVTPSEDTLASDLKTMMISMGEPFSTLSMFAQYKVMEEAKRLGIKVMLDGQGGDEVNLGYPRVAQMAIWQHMKVGNIKSGIKEWSAFAKNANTPMWKSLAWYIYFNSERITQNRKFSTVSNWVDMDFLQNYNKDIASDIFEPCSVYERQYKELKKYILPRLLRFADRNSMAFGVESRVPHLGQDLMNFSLSTRFDYRVRNGYTKFLERSAMLGKMPNEILWNPVKKGFDIPQAHWIDKLTPLINQWIEESPKDTPFKLSNIKKDLATNKKASPYFWRVISSLALVNLKSYKF